ncbi:MAG: hypothetical protein ACD_15C00077G0001 [uncultured bacterium]|nr:MAG: hypothetical protein ACD_15C00077G0001 [uncultured bacterium]HCU70905.1 hypothetical protein [Candidatus Moranbacteria bacterium]
MWITRSLPTTHLGASVLSSSSYKDNPISKINVTGLVGIKEKFYDTPRLGQIIIKKGIWGNTFTDVTVLGEYGAMYSHSDGIERFSEPGKHYIVIVEGSELTKKVPAAEVFFPHNH